MASPPGPPARPHPAAPQPPPPARGGDLDLKTLIITAVASAAAAFICSKVWAPGTLASAAFTPVAVAIFREALRKPTDVVTTALPAALPMTRRGPMTSVPAHPDDLTQVHGIVGGEDPTRVHDAAGGGPTGVHAAPAVGDPTRVHGAAGEPTRVSPAVGGADPAPGRAEPVAVHAVVRGVDRRRWWIAGGTGLLGFMIAAVLITVPEIVAGKERTTIFRESGSSRAPVVTTTQGAPATTVIQQITTVAPETVTTTMTVPTTTTTETRTVTREVAPTTTVTTPTTTTTSPEEPDAEPGAEVLP